MADKCEKQHSLTLGNNILTVTGVEKVLEITEREAQFKLSRNNLVVRGTGLNLAKLSREEGSVQLELQSISSIAYRQGGVKGFLR